MGTDVISLSRNFYDKTFNGWEGNVDVDFYRYYLAIDYGNWQRSYDGPAEMTYNNNGNYFRVGIDVNFLTKDPARNMFLLGGRYGHSSFDEDYFMI